MTVSRTLCREEEGKEIAGKLSDDYVHTGGNRSFSRKCCFGSSVQNSTCTVSSSRDTEFLHQLPFQLGSIATFPSGNSTSHPFQERRRLRFPSPSRFSNQGCKPDPL